MRKRMMLGAMGIALACLAVTPPVLATDPDGGSAPSFSGAPTGNGLRGMGVPQCCPSARAIDGVGVQMDDGEFRHEIDLARTPGVMLPFSLHLTYGSRSLYDGYVGTGFVSMFDMRATVLSGGHVEILMEDGIARTWLKNGSTFTAPQGILDTLTGSGSAYTRTRPDGFQYHYGPRLDSMNDRFGNGIAISRDGSGHPTAVTDSRGVSHTVTLWTNTKRLKELAMADGRAWTFKYDANANLTEILGPATASFSSGIKLLFAYSSGSGTPALNHNMTSATDGRSNTWLTATYDSSDRVATQTVGGATFSFAYGTPSAHKTTVEDRAGNIRVWEWQANTLARKSLVEQTNRGVRTGEGDYTTAWGSDSDGYVTSVTFPRGNGIQWTLNAAKLPTEERRKTDMSAGDDDDEDLVTTTTYDSSKYWGVTSRTDARGNTTSFTLNAVGQPTMTVFPAVTSSGSAVTHHEERTFNGDGTLASFTDAEGMLTTYGYFTTPSSKKGRLHQVVRDDGGLALTTTADYAAAGHLVSVTDPRGNTTAYTVEAYGNVTEIAAPTSLGYVTKLEHDGNLNVTKRRVKNIDWDGALLTPNWIETTFTFTTMDKLASAVEMTSGSSTRTTTFGYDPNDNLVSVVRGTEETEQVFDERDLLARRTRDPNGIAALETFQYDGNRNLVTHVNARGKSTTAAFDLFDRRAQVTNALGHYETVAYDKDGHVTETSRYNAVDALLAAHRASFDEMGRLWKEEDLLAGSPDAWLARTATLDGRGLVEKLTDRRGADTFQTFDGAGRLASRTDPMGNVEEFVRDQNGNVVTRTETEVVPGSSSTEAYETQFAYDALNRMATQTVIDRTNSANTKVTHLKRDALGFLRKRIEPEGNEIVFARDHLGRTTAREDAVSTTAYGFDIFDNLTSLTDNNGKTTSYAYDLLNRLTLTTYHDTSTIAVVRDANGNATEVTDQNGTVTAQSFDDLDRLISRSLTLASGVGGPTDEDFAYDGLDRLVGAANDDSTVLLTYDTLSRVVSETQGANPLGSTGKTVTSAWDAESAATAFAYPSGFETHLDRDDMGCLMEVTDGSSAAIAAFENYGPHMRVKSIAFGNGTTANFGYDGFRRPVSIAHEDSGSTEFAGFAYGFDKNDNPLFESRSHQGGHGDVYTYDAADRLTRALQDVEDPAAEVATPNSQVYGTRLAYNMDGVFNLTSYVTTPYGGSDATTSYTINSMNLYTAIGSTTPQYDVNGNLRDDGSKLYKFDGHNRLIEVRDKNTSAVLMTAKFDAIGFGRRFEKSDGTTTTRTIYRGEDAVEEYAAGSLARRFAYADGIDQPLMMEAPDIADVDGDENTSELKRFYYHRQLIGSVTHLTDDDDQVVETYEYDPYGKVTIRDQGGSPISASAVGNPWMFTARQWDPEAGLYHYRARAYSPELRRFIQRDPLEYVVTPNSVTYVSAAPTSTADPLGLEDESREQAQARRDAAAAGTKGLVESAAADSGSAKEADEVHKSTMEANNQGDHPDQDPGGWTTPPGDAPRSSHVPVPGSARGSMCPCNFSLTDDDGEEYEFGQFIGVMIHEAKHQQSKEKAGNRYQGTDDEHARVAAETANALMTIDTWLGTSSACWCGCRIPWGGGHQSMKRAWDWQYAEYYFFTRGVEPPPESVPHEMTQLKAPR